MVLEPYIRTPHYYETDQMGVIHHSNFVRWMEETRVHWLDLNGVSYHKMEQNGIVSPILSVSCQYKSMVRYGETVSIMPAVKAYSGVRLTLGYTFTDLTSGELRCLAESTQCFLNAEGKIVPLKRAYPQLDAILCEALT